MASLVCTTSICCSSFDRVLRPTMYALPACCSSLSSSNSCLQTLNFSLSSRFSQKGIYHFTSWNGLRLGGVSLSLKPQHRGRREKCRRKGVYASLFGVGAPEALVIGVVALLVFGPKGLAEVARNLGKTLRAFQPTIRELQEVSREFKSTLEREISLDDDASSMNNTYGTNRPFIPPSQPVSNPDDSGGVSVADPNGALSNNAYSSEEYLKITEEQLRAAAAAQQEATSSPTETPSEVDDQPQGVASPSNTYSEASMVAQQDVASSPSETESQGQEAAAAAPPVQSPNSEA